MVDNTKINDKIHCKFFEQFIYDEWNELRESRQGLEIARWRVHYWLEKYKEDIPNCLSCLRRKNAIIEGFTNAGIKFYFEPEVYFKNY